ncbi:hypothetical protein PV682_03775 [Streptomyces niveiscabiei]|nr:hypothetical protein [Streptomyces niveiscabiei]MDX3380566.1 hypothetical protein [Streptomyces niveiscabiei]
MSSHPTGHPPAPAPVRPARLLTTYTWAPVRAKHQANLRFVLDDLPDWEQAMTDELGRRKFRGVWVRIHDSGDFFADEAAITTAGWHSQDASAPSPSSTPPPSASPPTAYLSLADRPVVPQRPPASRLGEQGVTHSFEQR